MPDLENQEWSVEKVFDGMPSLPTHGDFIIICVCLQPAFSSLIIITTNLLIALNLITVTTSLSVEYRTDGL